MRHQYRRTVTFASMHAVERYMKRTGCKSETKAIQKLFEVAEHGVALSRNRFYYRGLICRVDGGTISTCYKPRRDYDMKLIFKRCREEETQPEKANE